MQSHTEGSADMKKRLMQIILMLCIALALPAGAALAAESGGEAPDDGAACAAEPVPLPPEEESGVFQSGAFTGPQTVPGQPQLLEDVWQEVYNRILRGMQERTQSRISIKDLAISKEYGARIGETVSQVLNDHPELFYVSWYVPWAYPDIYDSIQLTYYDFSCYGYSGIDQAQAAFDAAVAQALAVAEPEMTDLEKVLALHDYLVLHCAYNWEVATSIDDSWWDKPQNKHLATAFGTLVNGDAICQSYSLAYKLLLNRLGIGCIMIGSDAMNHVWNGVQLNGNWYQVDVTWDDPTPDIEGCCEHDYFLLSDETFRDPDGHHDWEDKVACTDPSYESGWIFNGGNHALYRRNGWYYFTREDRTALISLYRSSDLAASSAEALHANPGGSFYQGVVWLDDYIYYVPYASDGDYRLMRCHLDTGKVTQLDPFRFEKAPAPGGEYTAAYDRIGLRCRPESRSMEIVSRTRRAALESFPLSPETSGWETPAPGGGVSLAGLTADGTAGVLWGSPGAARAGGLTLWAAYYRDGRMVAVRGCEVPQAVEWASSPDLTLARVDTAGLPVYDQVRLMLVNGWTPACGAWAGQAA